MNSLLKHLIEKTSLLLVLAAMLCLPSMAKAQYTINSVHANLTDCDTMTRGIFIIWWDKDFNYSAQADMMLDSMLAYRASCLNDLAMQDPLSALDGHFCNIYIHKQGDPLDFFSVNFPSWGNGVGGDVNGYPFMTLPSFIITDWRNLAHETFHIFQTHGMWDLTPGIYNGDDGGWFVEASANWFSYNRYPTALNSFIESEILVRIPQVPLWLGWANLPNYYPNNWQRQVHQYALSTFLYYLTDQVGVTDSALVSIFYSGTSMNPQQYLFNQLGAAAFRNHFIDCAAHMTNDFDFILPSQANNALAEWNSVADPSDDNQFIQTYTNAGSGGWFRPADPLTTTAWSFNTYRLLNTQAETYTFELNGDVGGTFGYNAYFQGKILVRNSVTGARFYDLAMSNDYQGTLSLNLTPNDTAAYFIVASMPEVFADNNSTFQLFPYEMRIRTGIITGFSGDDLVDPDYQVGRWNLLGQPIQEEDGGLQVIRFSDGSTKKVFLPK